MTYGAPTPILAFVLAVVAGVLFANGNYAGGGVATAIAALMFALWRFAERRGDDDHHEIW